MEGGKVEEKTNKGSALGHQNASGSTGGGGATGRRGSKDSVLVHRWVSPRHFSELELVWNGVE